MSTTKSINYEAEIYIALKNHEKQKELEKLRKENEEMRKAIRERGVR